MPVGTRQNPSRSTSTDEICLITKDSLDGIFCEIAESRRLHLETMSNIALSLEKIANSLACTENNVLSNSANLCQKLDGLINVIKQSNESQTTPPNKIDDVLKHRKTLVEKIVRHEMLSEYYEELINEETPFARKALRTKVNQNSSEIDLRHRRQQTIDNVNREILIMQDRLVEFNKKKKILEEKIENFLKSNEGARSFISEQISEDDREARISYGKKLSIMKRTDQKEKGTITNYLLKMQGDSPKPSHDHQCPITASLHSLSSSKKRKKQSGGR